MKNNLLFMTYIFIVLQLFCAPKKKVIIMTPEEYGTEVVYKKISDEKNATAKRLIEEMFLKKDTILIHPQVNSSFFFCAPFLWSRIKDSIPVKDSVGMRTTLKVPSLDPNSYGEIADFDARIFRTDNDVKLALSIITSNIGKIDSLIVRKLTEVEKSMYWTYISWDIEEPVFMVDVNGRNLLIDLTYKDGQLALFYLEDFSGILQHRNKRDTIKSASQDAIALAKDDNLPAAIKSALNAVTKAKEHYGINHAEYAEAICDLATIYLQNDEVDKAEIEFLKGEYIFKKFYGKNSTQLPLIYSNLAHIYNRRGEYEKAEAILIKSIDIALELSGKESMGLALSYGSLASTYGKKKDHLKSLEYYKMALKIFEKNIKPDDPNMAIMYNNIGECYYHLEKYQKADNEYRMSEKILLSSIGSKHSLTIGIQGNLARNLICLMEYDRAEAILLKVLAFKEKRYGRVSEKLEENLEALKKLYTEKGIDDKVSLYGSWLKEVQDQKN